MAKHVALTIVIFGALLLGGCNQPEIDTTDSSYDQNPNAVTEGQLINTLEKPLVIPYDTAIKTIHIMVALCDNRYQGIVPVPAGIGNGQDPRTNLYWGCGYGIKTFFKRSAVWQLVKSQQIDTLILERAVFKHRTKNYYVVADAYNGKHIETCTRNFLKSTSGQKKDTANYNGLHLGIAGNAKLIAYIGHNGLMDFAIEDSFKNVDGIKRDVLMLACSSRYYFRQKFDTAYVKPIVWTKALMAPEAYTIHDAIAAYISAKPDSVILDAAISAYAKYQKCGKKGAASILVSGY